jgi:hypothetical protein
MNFLGARLWHLHRATQREANALVRVGVNQFSLDFRFAQK